MMKQDGGCFRLVMVIRAIERVGRRMDGRVFGWRLLVGRAWIYHDGVYACRSLWWKRIKQVMYVTRKNAGGGNMKNKGGDV